MDLDKPIEFLLQQALRAEEEDARLRARQEEFDKELRRMERLGARLVRRTFLGLDQLRETQRALAEQHRETASRLDAVISLMERHIAGGGSDAPAPA